ncbi:MAG: hypothetical protein AAGF24_10115, partial [Cyanobacteria bacterium P01_H01_bin.121]
MSDIQRLLQQLAEDESQIRSTQFLAPCLPKGKVRTRLAGLVYTFRPNVQDFSGWGIFQPVDATAAELIETASLAQIEQYLSHLLPIRVWLVHRLHQQTWLAYPGNEADLQQRLGW